MIFILKVIFCLMSLNAEESQKSRMEVLALNFKEKNQNNWRVSEFWINLTQLESIQAIPTRYFLLKGSCLSLGGFRLISKRKEALAIISIKLDH